MIQLKDDPIVACIERTGYPSWMQNYGDDYLEDDEYSNEPFAVYEAE